MRVNSLCKGKITIDMDAGTVQYRDEHGEETHPIDSDAGFALVSDAWIRSGWDTKYIYSFTWFGRPIIQLPDDMIRLQEVVWQVKPDVIIETGVAHGGGQIFFASLCKAMDKGRVIGVEVELRPHNRAAIDAHPLKSLITIVDGSSIDKASVEKVRSCIRPGERVLVFLDANHTGPHVLAELEAYAPMVSVGSYIIAADGIMQRLPTAPRSRTDWDKSNPYQAAREFLKTHPEFELAPPAPPFNEGVAITPVTYWPGAWLKRVR